MESFYVLFPASRTIDSMHGELEEGRLVPVWKALNHPFPQRVSRNRFMAAARTLDFLPFDVLNNFSFGKFETFMLKSNDTLCMV